MLSTILGFVRKELIETFRDKRMRTAIITLPLLQLLVYGIALSTYTRNVRLAVERSPDDAFARRLEQRLYASGWFIPAAPQPGSGPYDRIQSRRAEAVLVCEPWAGPRELGRGEARFQLLIDSAHSVRARSIENYAREILARALREEGLESSAASFAFSIRTFYNPERQTSIYLVPGTICMLIFVTIMALTSMSMARERERGTIETLFASPLTPLELLLGKTVPFVLIGLLQLPVGLLLARLMGVPMRGPLWMIAASMLVFLCCAVSIGLLVASGVRNQQQAIFATFFSIFPIIQLSGVIFPVENMPRAVAWLAYLNPLYYQVDTMRHLMLKGAEWRVVGANMGAVALIGLAAGLKVAAGFRTRVD